MIAPVRLLAAVGLLALAAPASPAQPGVAPPPHLPLDELVKEHRRLGLPVPPPNAELVRLKYWNDRPETPYRLGFRIPPKSAGCVR